MRFTVGHREIELTAEEVHHRMHGVEPEPIRLHLVEVNRQVFPPKQVFAAVTNFPRGSFTTLEAQRVLTKLGFICRRAGHMPNGEPAWVRDDEHGQTQEERLASAEAALIVQREAIASLAKRIEALEGAGR